MRNSAWYDLLSLIEGRGPGYQPAGFIIDSPWIPGWYGISKIDYYSSQELWFRSNLKAADTFPDLWFMPGFWAEFGMCTEPSAFGSRMTFLEDSLPHADKILSDIKDADKLPVPDVQTDGLLPFVIARLRHSHREIMENGHDIRFAVSRGPLNIASFLMGTTEFLMATGLHRDETHKLLERITSFVCDWLEYQRECFPSIGGALILDDIIGFLGEEDFVEFVLPYFRRIFDKTGFTVRFLHNDADGLVTAAHLSQMKVNMFNFSFNHTLGEIRNLTGKDAVLMGNIPPRDVLAAGTQDQVREAIRKASGEIGDHSGIIWSAGGGMAPDVPGSNLVAFTEEIRNLNKND